MSSSRKRPASCPPLGRNLDRKRNRTGPNVGAAPKRTRYQYSPLNEDANEIRLMTLLPGLMDDSEIRITLETVVFTKESNLDFEALSYTWGSPDNPVDILVGETGNDILSVTKNLAEALPFLRYPNKPRVLWIDAICVNQQDMDERSSQVKRMAEIYSKAPRVLIWLGPTSFDSRMAIDSLKLVHSKYRVHWGTLFVKPVAEDGSEWTNPDGTLRLSDEQYWSTSNLINRDWFERLWVWQEARLANEDTLVMCGSDTILWEDLCGAIVCIRSKPIPSAVHATWIKRFDEVEFLFRRGQWRGDFVNLIQQTRFCKCSEPRDRIFAVLGMLNEDSQLGIEPDYSKSVYDVYKDATLKHIQHTRCLEVLRSVEFHGLDDLPSWVPNWMEGRVPNIFNFCTASGPSLAQYVFGPGNLLQVTGKSISLISRVEPFNIDGSWSDESVLFPQLRDIAAKLGLLDSRMQLQNHIPAFCELICNNCFTDRYIPSNDTYPNRQHAELWLGNVLESIDGVFHSDTLGLFESIWEKNCYGRSLFITDDGRLGLCPQFAQPGDIVAVLLGCTSAMLLRPVTSNDPGSARKQYKVVGEAYCHGVMDNEAILGPLPGDFDAVMQYNESYGGYGYVYMDRETGVVDIEDPRMGDLPEPWSRLQHKNKDEYTVFLNQETGQKTAIRDPRLNADILRARGVELEVFDLI